VRDSSAWQRPQRSRRDPRPSAFQTSCHCRDARGWMKLPAGKPTDPHDRQGLARGALPALGQLQTPATIPYTDRRVKEFPHRRGGLPVRVIRPKRGWMVSFVSDGGWLSTLLSPLLSAQPRLSGGKPPWTAEPPGPRTGSGAAELRITRVSQCLARGSLVCERRWRSWLRIDG
jgi:hypothetical protein